VGALLNGSIAFYEIREGECRGRRSIGRDGDNVMRTTLEAVSKLRAATSKVFAFFEFQWTIVASFIQNRLSSGDHNVKFDFAVYGTRHL
jgi:hypothetical protein